MAFSCVNQASTNACSIPSLTFGLFPSFYAQNDIITVNAPAAYPGNTVTITIAGTKVATGVGKVTYNANTLVPGSYTVIANDVNTLVTVNSVLNVYPYFNYQQIQLPTYCQCSSYIYTYEGVQMPVVSWNGSNPGIYYVNNAGNLEEYQASGTAVKIAKPTLLYSTSSWVGSQDMIPNLFFIEGPNQDTALFEGTLASGGSGDVYVETVNLTTGNVLGPCDTKFAASTSGGAFSANYWTGNIVYAVEGSGGGAAGTIDMVYMSTCQEWSGGSITHFEPNNEYFLSIYNSIISVEASNLGNDQAQQLVLSGAVGSATATSVSTLTLETDTQTSAYVNGLLFDSATNKIAFLYGYNNPGGSASSGHTQHAFVVPFTSSNVITATGLVNYTQPFPAYIAPYEPASGRVYTTATGFGPSGSVLLNQQQGNVMMMTTYQQVNVFNTVATSMRSMTIPVSPSNLWFSNESTGESGGLDFFFYKNANYGIAPNSLDSLQTTNLIYWYWNATMPEFPQPAGVNVVVNPSQMFLDIGQIGNFIATPQKGVAPYTYAWYNLTSGSAVSMGVTSNNLQLTAGAASPPAGFTYNVIVKDAGTNTFTSSNVILSVNSVFEPNTITPASQSVTQGSTATINGNLPIGGTVPYVYQWYEEAPGAGSFTPAVDCAPPTAQSCSFTTTGTTTLGTYSFYEQQGDSSTGGPYANSVAADTNIATVAVSLAPTTAPVNVMWELPITITNLQSTNTAIPWQQEILANSMAYSTYENSILNNIEFFYANGTVVPSWLEGNYPGLTGTTYQIAGASSASKNTIYWVSIANGLAAIGQQGSSITIYMGFYPTTYNAFNSVVGSPANWLTGEAPELSQMHGPGYGAYDNGNVVFPFYTGFESTSLPSYMAYQGYGTSKAAVNNGMNMYLGAVSSGNFVYPTTVIGSSYVTEAQESNSILGSTTLQLTLGETNTITFNSAQNPPTFNSIYRLNMRLGVMQCELQAANGVGSACAGSYEQPYNVFSNTILSLAWPATGVENLYGNYTPVVLDTDTEIPIQNYRPVLGIDGGSGYSGFPQTVSFWWFRARQYPPGGVMPGATPGGVNSIGTFIESGLPANSESWSVTYMGNSMSVVVANVMSFFVPAGNYLYTVSSVIDPGSGKTWNPSPSTYNLLAPNSVVITFTPSAPGTSVFSVTFNDIPSGANVVANGVQMASGASNTFLSPITINAIISGATGNWVFSTWTGASPTGGTTSNFVFTSPTVTNTFATVSGNGIVTANWNALSVTMTASNALISSGGSQFQILTATLPNGIQPITYNFLVYNAVNALVYNDLFNLVASTTNSFTFTQQSAWGNGIFTANMIATDLGANPNVIVKNSITYTAAAAPGAPTVALSSCVANAVVDVGQYETCTETTSGGVSPYNAVWYISQAGSPSTIANSYVVNNIGTSNTYTYLISNPDVANSQEVWNVVVTDSSPTTINSVLSSAYNVFSALALSSPIPDNFITVGNSVTLSSSVTSSGTGTANLIYFWSTSLADNIILTTTEANALCGTGTGAGHAQSTSCTYTTPATTGVYESVLTVKDTDTTTPYFASSTMANVIDYAIPKVPTGIGNYIPVLEINNQVSNLGANVPVAITVNALEYKSYYTCNLNNAEFFFGNGTVATSWLQGNITNQIWANALCTSSSSPNALINSNGVAYWIENAWKGYLNGNAPTTAPSNILFLGWGTSNLMDGIKTGEAPELSCFDPIHTAIGCNSLYSYGKYDNGNVIFGTNGIYSNFSVYQDSHVNFQLPNPWTIDTNCNDGLGSCIDGGSGNQALGPNNGYSFLIDNGLTLSVFAASVADSYGNAIQIYANTQVLAGIQFSFPHIAEFEITNVTNPRQSSLIAYDVGVTIANDIHNGYYSEIVTQGSTLFVYNGLYLFYWKADLEYIPSGSFCTILHSQCGIGPNPTSQVWEPGLWGATWSSAGAQSVLTPFETVNTTATGLSSPIYEFPSMYVDTGNVYTTNAFIQYARSRAYPPDGVMPINITSTNVIAVLYSLPSPISLIPSNAIVDQGQFETLTYTVSGGTTPYTYNFVVANTAVSPTNTIANYIIGGVNIASNTFTFNVPVATNAIGVDYMSGNLIDNNGNNALLTNTLKIDSQFLSTLWTASNYPITSTGNFQVLTAGISGGTPTYTYNFLVYNAYNVLVDSALFPGLGASNTFTFTQSATWGVGLYTANIIVEDSASTNAFVQNSLQYTVVTSGASSNFIETGLPHGATWNVIYGGTTGSSNTNTITIFGSGTPSFTVANQLVFGTNYISSPNAGTLAAGNNQFITFTPNVMTPSNIVYYVPINITNSQLVNAPAPFQQLIPVNNLNYTYLEAGNLQNVEFFYGNGTVVPSWMENNNTNTSAATLFWLRFNAIIPASSTVQAYLGFSPPTNSLLNKYLVGESPVLSGNFFTALSGAAYFNYGQYDDGNTVFNGYWNFSGTGSTLPSGWSKSGTLTTSLNNGVTITGTTGGYDAAQSTQTFGAGNVVDWMGWLDGSVSGGGAAVGLGSTATTNFAFVGYTSSATQYGLYSAASGSVYANTIPYNTGSSQTATAPVYTFSVGFTSGYSFAQVNYGTAGNAVGYATPAAPGAAEPVQMYESNGHIYYVQWIHVRNAPPNNQMPTLSFGKVYNSVTATTLLPSLTISSNPGFYAYSDILTANAPLGTISNTVNIYVNGVLEASGVGGVTYNTNMLPIGHYVANTVDANTLAFTSNVVFNIVRSYDWTKINLPGYNAMTSYLYSGWNTQEPVVAWNGSRPGIYYVDKNNNLDEFEFINGNANTVVTIAPITPLYQNWPSAAYYMLENEFWLEGPNNDHAVFFGTLTNVGNCGSGNLYIETVNLTTGNVLMVNTGVSASATCLNAQVDYLGGNYVDLVVSSGAIDMYDMGLGTEWSGGSLAFFEANNEYWLPNVNSIINVQAGGLSGDQVQQMRISGNYVTPKQHPVFTQNALITIDSGVTVNYVNGLSYDSVGNGAVSFIMGYANPGGSVSNGHELRSYAIPFSSPNGNVVTAGMIRYYAWPQIMGAYTSTWRTIVTTTGFTLQQTELDTPDVGGSGLNGIGAFLTYTDVNPFAGKACEGNMVPTTPCSNVIPVPANNVWLFNGTQPPGGTPAGIHQFWFKNDSYGIAPVSTINGLDSSPSGNIIWFWNSSVTEFPVQTFSMQLSNTAINFGIIPPGVNTIYTNNFVVANNIGLNAANILLNGTVWTYLSNTFAAGNTVWNSANVAIGLANSLPQAPSLVDTNVVLPGLYPSISSNGIHFGVSVPGGTPPGTYTQNIVFTDKFFQTAVVTASLTVPSTCYITLANTLIGFGALNPGTATGVGNQVIVQNLLGGVPANILVEGSNWITGSTANFFVANTLWNNAYEPTYTGMPLPLALSGLNNFYDTDIVVPIAGSNYIYFGVAVPPGQTTSTYVQNIIVENKC